MDTGLSKLPHQSHFLLERVSLSLYPLNLLHFSVNFLMIFLEKCLQIPFHGSLLLTPTREHHYPANSGSSVNKDPTFHSEIV